MNNFHIFQINLTPDPIAVDSKVIQTAISDKKFYKQCVHVSSNLFGGDPMSRLMRLRHGNNAVYV